MTFPIKARIQLKIIIFVCLNELDMKRLFAVHFCAMILLSGIISCASPSNDIPVTVGNPFLPLWEHIPDGEPYVFEDPDNPGQERVYVYGSHDTRITDYCGRELVVWSAPVDDLNQWRYDGEIFRVSYNAQGEPVSTTEVSDVLFAPDVAVKTEQDGTKMYYLYPNDQEGGRQSLIARSPRPDGPFEVCNWSEEDPYRTEGVLGFDPAVFADDDGKVYGYWGFERSYAVELDPVTMCTVKEGTQIIEDMISSGQDDDVFRFFEASSIRKIKDKYVFIYSRWTRDGEFGLPSTNYTLAYAYSDAPLGPWTYGGTIIDARGREVDEDGNVIASATVSGNTHGGICEIGGQWYVFYHRQTGLDEFARQAMVAPITVEVQEGKGGKVEISEGEYDSQGFAIEGLDPLEVHSAGIACWYTGPRPAEHVWPKKIFYGSYVASGYGTDDKFEAPYALRNNTNPVVNNTDGSIVGYKYFNFTVTSGRQDLQLVLNLVPEGVDGTVTVMADRPWESQGGIVLGQFDLKADMPQVPADVCIALPDAAYLTGRHAIFLKFESEQKGESICVLNSLIFK